MAEDSTLVVPSGRACTVCKIWKPIQHFWISKRDGVLGRCKECTKSYQREYDRKNKEKINARQKARVSKAWVARGAKPKMPTVETPEGRLCSKCGERKPRSEFTPHSGCAGGLSRRCKTCAQKQHAEWREKNAEHVRKKGRETRENIYWRDPQAARLREKRLRFNLTAEQLSEMMVAQGARCLVCKNEFVNSFSNNAKPCIDHCHKSKKIRGILCNACNTALGMLKDNPDIADAAAAYLRKHAP